MTKEELVDLLEELPDKELVMVRFPDGTKVHIEDVEIVRHRYIGQTGILIIQDAQS